METKLPAPQKKGGMSVEEALSGRKSRREYKGEIELTELSQILWAGQGINRRRGRTAPSGGAIYPFRTYVLVGEVAGLPSGIYEYLPEKHSLELKKEGNFRENAWEAAHRQETLLNAAFTVVLAAEYPKTTARYGERGIRYVLIEAGHICQNIYLQAESLGLGTVAVGAFEDEKVKKILEIIEEPVYLIPLGKI